MKAGKTLPKKAEELWTQVLTDCRKRYTDGRILVQWLRGEPDSGIEKDSIWYGDIEDIEEFEGKEKLLYCSFLQKVQRMFRRESLLL